ncbi:LysR family transcriptional regulator [Pacificimonas sp. WHA3]|uniref:LysR family transcriptional regulator n=1 Tax=Pacificimonas pallii TaxID=2827236 RepID=A0ABS6SEF2_9SPHN|nr:LysR family transcriptional regulator [Pacificimonas pallii]MBV7256792.1 LysR family transcriptional regulator [Pacificimonas pallii]
MKRSLLPLNGLRVFDAAARHLSFTKAADELHVTPAAVGQQIRTLEEVLGVVLFRRLTRNLELTPEAEAALPALRDGFAEIETAVDRMQSGQGDKVMTIGAPRAVIGKWLSARLAALGADAPEQRFILVPTDDGTDFATANMDLAVRWGALPAEEELSGARVAEEQVIVVAAPAAAANVAAPADLLTLSLIHHPGESWQAWFDGHGLVHKDVDGGLSVVDEGLALDAAASGYGIARVPLTLARDDINARRVVQLFDGIPSDDHFWLVAPPERWRQAKVKAVVTALTA